MVASINEHRVLMDAFVQHDAARAERAMHDHLMAQLTALKKLRRTAVRGAATAPAGRPARRRPATPANGPRHAR